MGFVTEFNWVLKLTRSSLELPLTPGMTRQFEKSDLRIYPIDIPIDLVDEDWTVQARIRITEVTVGHGKTRGSYTVVSRDER